jgi:hypothetical protein
MDTEKKSMKVQASPAVIKYAGSLFKDGRTKINFADGNPKLFLEVSSVDFQLLKLKEGSTVLGNDEMIVGYEEGMMMIAEKLIRKPGDTLANFFGIPSMRVVGILEPTGTLVDNYHLVSAGTFSRLTGEDALTIIVEDDGGIEYFYTIRSAIPDKLKGDVTFGSLKPVVIGKKTYIPMYFGSEEAAMMIKKGEFRKTGDTLRESGNDVIVAGILPKTNTVLDGFHFAGEAFKPKD